jgi:hypothetical protein
MSGAIHDRAIDDAQAGHATEAQSLVEDSHRILAHPAGPGEMRAGRPVPATCIDDLVIRAAIGARKRLLVDTGLQGWLTQQAADVAGGSDCNLPIVFGGQEVPADCGRRGRIGGAYHYRAATLRAKRYGRTLESRPALECGGCAADNRRGRRNLQFGIGTIGGGPSLDEGANLGRGGGDGYALRVAGGDVAAGGSSDHAGSRRRRGCRRSPGCRARADNRPDRSPRAAKNIETGPGRRRGKLGQDRARLDIDRPAGIAAPAGTELLSHPTPASQEAAEGHE